MSRFWVKWDPTQKSMQQHAKANKSRHITTALGPTGAAARFAGAAVEPFLDQVVIKLLDRVAQSSYLTGTLPVDPRTIGSIFDLSA